ncbi:MAG: DNA repair protein RecN [Acidimicrobiales bacterium]|nr:DNA repair protein RecN [Acidimicrobiales bacterium]RZV45438.1 MAG: DNA repair protein RecN [Acidimicrobiales bacterium]
MLAELQIRNLGVIEDLTLLLPEGTIAVTGETGAGKTMVVGAIQLLMGVRADADVVRVGAEEASVEGRFIEPDGTEVVVRRVVPTSGRSRAYIDGSLATVTAVAERIEPHVDLHGQHAQQSLLRISTQRDALDQFGQIDLRELRECNERIATINRDLAELGGDATERARTMDLLRYQVDELAAAAVDDPHEEDQLREEEDLLASAFDVQHDAQSAAVAIGSDGPATDAIGQSIAALGQSTVFDEHRTRLQNLQDELAQTAVELRTIAETTVDDPERRQLVRERRQLLVELKRKYGPELADVVAYHTEVADRLAALESHDERVLTLSAALASEEKTRKAAAATVLAARRAAGPKLASAVEAELRGLAMPAASIDVEIEGEAGDEVSILLAPNPGMPALPIGKGASGGELSRTMLALRLVLSGGPPIKVFDEVDAGIGGETARSVGLALSQLADAQQVFVVTHLPQVAAHADHHIVINKDHNSGSTVSQAYLLSEDERIVELSRMLSGSPDSSSAREHAEELLATSRGNR